MALGVKYIQINQTALNRTHPFQTLSSNTNRGVQRDRVGHATD